MPFQPPALARTETHLAESGRMKSLRDASAPLESDQAASAVSATSTEIRDETRDALRRLSLLIRQQAQAKVAQGEGDEVDAVNRQVMEGRDAQAASDRARFLSEDLQSRWRAQRGISRYKSEGQRARKMKKSNLSQDANLRDPSWVGAEALANETEGNEASNSWRGDAEAAVHAERFASAEPSLEMQAVSESASKVDAGMESASGADFEVHSDAEAALVARRDSRTVNGGSKRRYYRAA